MFQTKIGEARGRADADVFSANVAKLRQSEGARERERESREYFSEWIILSSHIMHPQCYCWQEDNPDEGSIPRGRPCQCTPSTGAPGIGRPG